MGKKKNNNPTALPPLPQSNMKVSTPPLTRASSNSTINSHNPMPPHDFHKPKQKETRINSKPAYKDIWASILFAVQLIAFLGLAVYACYESWAKYVIQDVYFYSLTVPIVTAVLFSIAYFVLIKK